jgi:hypothetical protein
VAIARETDGINLLADSLVDLAEVLRSAGKDADGDAALDEATRLYVLKGNEVASKQAAAMRREGVLDA